MGKKHGKSQQSGRPPVPQNTSATPGLPPSGLVGRLMATSIQVANIEGDAAPEWSEELVTALVTTLPDESRSKFLSFVEQFARMGARAKEAHDRYEKETSDLHDRVKAQEDGLEERAKDLSVQIAEMSEARSVFERAVSDQDVKERKIEAERAELALQRNKLVEETQKLTVREAELRGGLVLEREKSMLVLQDQIFELEARRNQIPHEISGVRQELMDSARRDADALREVARKQAEALNEKEISLAGTILELERREEKLRLAEKELSLRLEHMRSDARDEFQAKLDEKDAKLARLEKEKDRLRKVQDTLEVELDDLEVLREAVGDDPQRLVEEVERFRSENKRLDRELQTVLANQTEGDAKEIKIQRDALQDRLKGMEADLFGLRQKEHQWTRSVMDMQNAEITRQVLEKRNALLGSAAQQLREEVDQLIEKQKDGTVFPELTRMDRELTLLVTTDAVPSLSTIVSDLQSRIAYAEPLIRLHYPKDVLQLFLGGLSMSHLHIFQGISGTGKTSLATAFSKAVGAHCTVIPVQAGWRDRSDLIGHYNAFERRYYEKETLQALYRAQTEAERDKLHVILLDEMNLSRPEQYFAEFLSAMEVSHDKRHIELMNSQPASGAPTLLRDGRWIRLPSNVWFIGTANHDETTNAFADKTHDRAFVLELPKQDLSSEKIERPKNSITWSFQSLIDLFKSAEKQHQAEVRKLLKHINESALTTMLNDDFGLGWGNRLDQQMVRFMPVVIESGGTAALAVDHMLSTRMFREGKVIGRHDMTSDALRRVEDALRKLWKDCALDGQPDHCLKALTRDIQRLERGG
jgi:hypothetical protein